MGKGEFKIVEEVIYKKLPHEIFYKYETDGVTNQMKNFFSITKEGTTKWKADINFTSNKLALRLIIFFKPSIFKSKTKKTMQPLKTYIEREVS